MVRVSEIPPSGMLKGKAGVITAKSPALVPPGVAPFTLKVAVPVSKMLREAVTDEPTGALPRSIVTPGTGFEPYPGMGAGRLEPLSLTWCGLPGALSVISKVTLSAPVVLGVKVTFRLRLPPGATVTGTVVGEKPSF